MNTETLVILQEEHYQGMTLMSKSQFHPVAFRHGGYQLEDYNIQDCVYIKSYSEEFGDERGYLALRVLENINCIYFDVKTHNKLVAKEIRESEITDGILSTINSLALEVSVARYNYTKYLEDLDYKRCEVSDYYCIDTRHYMIHPFYYEEFERNNSNCYNDGTIYPAWAVIEIGEFEVPVFE